MKTAPAVFDLPLVDRYNLHLCLLHLRNARAERLCQLQRVAALSLGAAIEHQNLHPSASNLAMQRLAQVMHSAMKLCPKSAVISQ